MAQAVVALNGSDLAWTKLTYPGVRVCRETTNMNNWMVPFTTLRAPIHSLGRGQSIRVDCQRQPSVALHQVDTRGLPDILDC